VDARLDLDKKSLIPEVQGRLLDVDATLAALRSAIGRGDKSASAVFEAQKPKRVVASSGASNSTRPGLVRDALQPAEKYQARPSTRLAASKLDGYVLLPGEVFDFNEVVGARDEANGYKVATVIAEGELSTASAADVPDLRHAAWSRLLRRARGVERYPHTRRARTSRWAHATVVYPTINFRLKNDFDHPVVLHEVVKKAWCVRRSSAAALAHRQLIRRIDSAIPYEESSAKTDLADGVRALSQRGVAGFKIHRYRIVREGEHAVRERGTTCTRHAADRAGGHGQDAPTASRCTKTSTRSTWPTSCS